MEKEYYHEMIASIDSLNESGDLEHRHIVVFGHCEATERAVDYLSELGKHVKGIADNNEKKWGIDYRGIAVKAPKQLLTGIEGREIILIASKAYEPMKRLCISLGCDNVKKIVDYNTFSEFSLDIPIFIQKQSRIIKGYSTWNRLNLMYQDTFFVVCPYGAMGDVYQAILYLPPYLEKHQSCDAVIIVQGKTCRQTAELFQYKVEALSKKDMDELVQYLIFTRPDNTLIVHHDRPYTNCNIVLSEFRPITFREHYRIGVYGLSEGSQPVYPMPKRTGKIFSELVKGNSVILSPYAKSMVMLQSSFWEQKAIQLKREGWYVYTNISEEEKPVPGTVPISYPISDMIEAAEYAGYFVGIRSGLCDVLTTADCKKEIIYPDCIYSSTGMTVQEFF